MRSLQHDKMMIALKMCMKDVAWDLVQVELSVM